jgi:hypothetical protein
MATSDGRTGRRLWLRRDTRVGRLLYLVVVTAPLVVLFALDRPVCLTAMVLRRPCPGCGLTRATIELLHGHVAAAIALHPLAPIVSPLVLGGFAIGAARYIRTGRTDFKPWVAVAASIMAALLVAVWLARWIGAFGGPVPV